MELCSIALMVCLLYGIIFSNFTAVIIAALGFAVICALTYGIIDHFMGGMDAKTDLLNMYTDEIAKLKNENKQLRDKLKDTLLD